MQNFRPLFILFLVVLVTAGCENSTKPNVEKSTSNSTSDKKKSDQPEQANSDESEKEITVEIASWDELQKFIGTQKGKVVVLDIWSSSCLPCIKEYPNLVKLQNEYPETVACVSFNTNYYGGKNSKPEDEIEDVLPFLKKKKSTLSNFISSTPDEELYKQIELASIPVVYVYDQEGKLEKRFDNDELKSGEEGFSYENDVTPLVKKLLNSE